jgi:hypothetical protein
MGQKKVSFPLLIFLCLLLFVRRLLLVIVVFLDNDKDDNCVKNIVLCLCFFVSLENPLLLIDNVLLLTLSHLLLCPFLLLHQT